MTNLQIQGSAGELEAVYTPAAQSSENPTTAVLCHPHPQYGGNMQDGVISTCESVLLSHGINCIRFNFRGVGASAGRFDQGVGEQEDIQSVVAWLRSNHPDHTLWLAGYSFGSNMAFRCVVETGLFPEPEKLILIAPPVGMMSFDGALPDQIQTIVIAGSADDFVDASKLAELDGASASIIEGADHFFMGYHEDLATQLSNLVG
ncbi:MAG: alpha/beta fold hydrolase [Pseudomonadota bacterium]